MSQTSTEKTPTEKHVTTQQTLVKTATKTISKNKVNPSPSVQKSNIPIKPEAQKVQRQMFESDIIQRAQYFSQPQDQTNFNPLQRNLSPEEKNLLATKVLTTETINFPYQTTKQEEEMFEALQDGQLPAEKRDQYVTHLLRSPTLKKPSSLPQRTKPTSAQTNANDRDAGYAQRTETTSTPSSSSLTSKIGTVTSDVLASLEPFMSDNVEEKSEEKSQQGVMPETDAEAENNTQRGTILKDRIDFIGEKPIEVSERIHATHRALKVYAINPGEGAGSLLRPFGGSEFIPFYKKKPIIEAGRNDVEGMHNMFRFPPNWSNRFRFSSDKKEDARLATLWSNRFLMSLGTGGSITFEVQGGAIVNRAGADFKIWSNPFCYIKTKESTTKQTTTDKSQHMQYMPFSQRANLLADETVTCETELAKVYVSPTGPNANDFQALEPCAKESDGPLAESICAGWGLNYWFVQQGQSENLHLGGDSFDLSDVNLARIKAIKIVDLGNEGAPTQAGFDLDAIAMLYYEKNAEEKE